jgi:hypothetical protein
MVVPFEGSYWVVSGKLLAGCYPSDKRPDEAGRILKALLDAGIRTFIDLTEEHEADLYGFEPYEESIRVLAGDRGLTADCVRFPIPDMDVPSPVVMKQILDAGDAAIVRGKPVFVHCLGGRGRTGTVVGCWLARHGRATGNQALDLLRKLRKNDPTWVFRSPETEQQRQMVKRWKQGQ